MSFKKISSRKFTRYLNFINSQDSISHLFSKKVVTTVISEKLKSEKRFSEVKKVKRIQTRLFVRRTTKVIMDRGWERVNGWERRGDAFGEKESDEKL